MPEYPERDDYYEELRKGRRKLALLRLILSVLLVSLAASFSVGLILTTLYSAFVWR